MNVKIKKLTETATIPTKGTEYSAGYDLYADIDKPIMFLPGTMTILGTGISLEIPKGYFGAVFPRSGIATKKGLRLINCVGIIDSDYRGEIKVALINDHPTNAAIVESQERIAQLIILPYPEIEFDVVEELTETDRGDGGFGSTGTN